jgi:hypothetical protein
MGAAASDEAVNFKLLKLDGNNVRWQLQGDGHRHSLSYSLVKEDVAFAGARNCRKMTRLDQLEAASAIAAASMRAEITAAFALWQAAANVDFVEAASPEAADILIGAQAEPQGWAFADVFYDVRSPEPFKPISKSLICLNPAKRWKIGFDGDLMTYDLRYTLAHEIGHAIGLDHPNGAAQIMGYRYEENFRDLQPGDIAGAVSLYGAHEPATITVGVDPSRSSSGQGPTWGTRAFTAPSP